MPVFENALTYASIFFASRQNKTSFYYHRVPSLPFVEPNSYKACCYCDFSDEPWYFVFNEKKALLNKLQKISLLKEIASAKGGVISGNDACFLYESTDCPFEDKMSLELIRTDDISRYHMGKPKLKVFYPCELNSCGETCVLDLDEMKQKYPKAFLHIMNHEQKLKMRKDSRDVMGNKKYWYQPVRFGTLKLFKGEKILGPGIVKHNKFVLDEKGYAYSFGNMYAIVAKDKRTNMKVLLGILNSKLIEYYLHCIAPVKQGGYFSYGATILEKIPIIYPNIEKEGIIHGIVTNILKNKDVGMDTSVLENRIDFLVYHLYNLTYDEVLVVDPNPPFTREEYDAYKVEQ